MTDQAPGIDRFRQLIDAYGAKPERWPAVDRAAAIAFRAQSAEARAYADAAAALDAARDQAPAQMPSAALRGRVLAAAPSARSSGWRDWLFGQMPVWRPVTAFAAAALLGLGLGWAQPVALPASEAVVIDVAAFSFAITAEEEVN